MAKKAKQLTFPGMKAPKRVKPEVEKPAKKRSDKLGEELAAGQRPMFMTGGEVIKHANLMDAGSWNQTAVGERKSNPQKNKEKNVMARKLQESKTGTYKNSHTLAKYQDLDADGFPMQSLHENLSEKGLQGPITLHEQEAMRYKLGSNEPGTRIRFINLGQGHHRVAAVRNINPKQFMAIKWESGSQTDAI